MDVIYQGETWRRQVTITDDADPPGPVDPDDLTATLCALDGIAMTVTGPDDPGVYLVSFTAEQTSSLPAQFVTYWDLFGTIGSDRRPLTREDIVVQPTCQPVTS